MTAEHDSDNDDFEMSPLYAQYCAQRGRRVHADATLLDARARATADAALSDRSHATDDSLTENSETDAALREVDALYRRYQQDREADHETSIQKVLELSLNARSDVKAQSHDSAPVARSLLRRIFELPGDVVTGLKDKLGTANQPWLMPAGAAAAVVLAVALFMNTEPQMGGGQQMAEALGLPQIAPLLDAPTDGLAAAVSALPAEPVRYGFSGSADATGRAYRGGQLVMTLAAATRADQRSRATESLAMITALYSAPEVPAILAAGEAAKALLDRRGDTSESIPDDFTEGTTELAVAIGAHHREDEQPAFSLGVWSRATRLALQGQLSGVTTPVHSLNEAYTGIRDGVINSATADADLKAVMENLQPLPISEPPTANELRALGERIQTLDAAFTL